jgi:hypothetical protein
MKIKILKPSGKLDKSSVNRAIKFYCKKLFTKKQLDKLEIDIIFRRFKPSNYYSGYCDQIDQWTYEVEINENEAKLDLLLFLAHEFVHIEQYVLLKLIDIDDFHSFWNGKKFSISKMDYYDLPWEIDANGREKGLFNRFMESLTEKQKDKILSKSKR